MSRFLGTLSMPQTARASARAGIFESEASITVTPAGLLAIGGLVAAILLSIPPIVRAARQRRGRPLPDAGLPPLLADTPDTVIESEMPRLAATPRP